MLYLCLTYVLCGFAAIKSMDLTPKDPNAKSVKNTIKYIHYTNTFSRLPKKKLVISPDARQLALQLTSIRVLGLTPLHLLCMPYKYIQKTIALLHNPLHDNNDLQYFLLNDKDETRAALAAALILQEKLSPITLDCLGRSALSLASKYYIQFPQLYEILWLGATFLYSDNENAKAILKKYAQKLNPIVDTL